jgi:shikimate 5-dehydrogenase
MIPISESENKTMYFIGASTAGSSGPRIFNDWCKCMGIRAKLVTLEIPTGASDKKFRDVVQSIRHEQAVRGALIKTHKTRIFESAQDLFDEVQKQAQELNEVGAIFRIGMKLVCEATDPLALRIASDRLLKSFMRAEWSHVVILGGGGAGLALAHALLSEPCLVTGRMTLVEASQDRVEKINEVTQKISHRCSLEIEHNPSGNADRFVQDAADGALIVNATSKRKDFPDSPLSSNCKYPYGSILWDFNYRGDLQFLEKARPLAKRLQLKLNNGWYYFVCSWFQVMTRVFDAPQNKETLAAFEVAAEKFR